MIQDIKDRIPTDVLSNGAIRYGVYDENNNLLRYEYIKREDEPLEEGTNINRALFKNLQGDLYTNDRYSLITPTVLEETVFIESPPHSKDVWNETSLTQAEYSGKNILFKNSKLNASSTSSSTYSVKNPIGIISDSDYSWRSSSSTSAWWKITFGMPIQLNQIHIASSGEFTLQGCVDDTEKEWITLYTATSSIDKTITLQNQAKYKKYRVYFEYTSATTFVLWSFGIVSLYAPKYIFNSDIPLSSYEEGKIANLLPNPLSEANYQSKEFSTAIQPTFSSIASVTNEYGTWGIRGGYNGASSISSLSSAFDGDLSTYASGSISGTYGYTYVELYNASANTKWAICPKEISVTTRAFSGVVLGFDPVESEWVILGKPSSDKSDATTSTISLANEERFFTAFRLLSYRYSSSYDTAYFYDFKIVAGTVRYGANPFAQNNTFTYPYLKIGNLQEKMIATNINSGEIYQLVYRNNRWEVPSSGFRVKAKELNYIYGIQGKIILDVKAKAVLFTLGGSSYLLRRGESQAISNRTHTLDENGETIGISYTGGDAVREMCLIFY